MLYHKIKETDCLEVATSSEKAKLSMIMDLTLLENLAQRWCDKNGYKLGGYLGNVCWDATCSE